jgi:quercetin dioxygenase-like cupin family protein
VLDGTLTLLIENEPRELAKGDLARVGPEVRRQLVNGTREPVLVLALGGAKAHESRDARAYHSWDEEGDGHPPKDVPYPDA